MIAIIDYDAGNLASVAYAVSHLGHDFKVTNDIETIRNAQRIIFPGVGAAGAAMRSLIRLGLDRVIREAFSEGKPILGICIGSQIIVACSEEDDTHCEGLLEGRVRAFAPGIKQENSTTTLKIPHMGWNRIHIKTDHPLLRGHNPQDEFYFVHSFFPEPSEPDCIVAQTRYGIEFASIIAKKHLVATQFHLEKSGKPGLQMLQNFCLWQPQDMV
jgi:glutamine amidotransferase